MKYLLRSIPIFALVLASCTTTNNPVTNIYVVDSLAPTITGFKPDTVWTFGTLTIYGNHLGYDVSDVNVALDTVQSGVYTANDTIITVRVPEYAQTGPIIVATINGTTTSAKPVTIEYTFNPHTINDTLPIGASFSISGTGMNHSHGLLQLTVAGIYYPIDSIFPNRIVSHVLGTGISGSIYISDSGGSFVGGYLTVTRPSAWNTLSEIWDHVTVTEYHTRTGYVNGSANTIDSSWQTTATYLGQHDENVSGISFTKISTGLDYIVPDSSYPSSPTLSINWDTATQLASVNFNPSWTSTTPTLTVDSSWSATGSNLTATLPVEDDIEFAMPTFIYYENIDSTDTQGLVNWQERITGEVTSGSFDLILKR